MKQKIVQAHFRVCVISVAKKATKQGTAKLSHLQKNQKDQGILFANYAKAITQNPYARNTVTNVARKHIQEKTVKTRPYAFCAGEHMRKYIVKHIATNANKKVIKENIVE